MGCKSPSAPRFLSDPDNAKLEVHYGVVLLRSQERIRFRYMLEGFDKTGAMLRQRAWPTTPIFLRAIISFESRLLR